MLEIFREIKLNRENESPLYQQLFEMLRELAESGRLLHDTRLPSIRDFAHSLGVNQVTVVSAYKKLEEGGYVYSRTGSGTYVADLFHRIPARAENPLLQDELYPNADNINTQGGQVLVGENIINFASASPTSDLFPVDNFKIVLNEVLDRDKGNAFSYHESQGFLPLRESITGLLAKGRMNFPIEDIHVISGAQQGIDIIAKAMIRQDDCILTESPTYTGAVAVFRSRNAQLTDVTMRPGGPDLNQMEYLVKKYRPRFMYTIPSFQNPTGFSYTDEKRKALLALADKYDFFIIEDDYVSDLDFSHLDYKPLKAMDTRGRVILIKSFSKLFMPGLRLGFMVVPAKLSQDILAAKHTTDISTSGLVQRAFDLYIRRGYWSSHFEFMYRIYGERYVRIIEALDKYLPDGCSYIKPGGGLNIWITLPAGFPVSSLLHAAAARDIAFAPGNIFHSGNTPDAVNNIRLSFAALQTERIETGIEQLCVLIRQILSAGHTISSMSVF